MTSTDRIRMEETIKAVPWVTATLPRPAPRHKPPDETCRAARELCGASLYASNFPENIRTRERPGA